MLEKIRFIQVFIKRPKETQHKCSEDRGGDDGEVEGVGGDDGDMRDSVVADASLGNDALMMMLMDLSNTTKSIVVYVKLHEGNVLSLQRQKHDTMFVCLTTA